MEVLWGWAQSVKMFMTHADAHQNKGTEEWPCGQVWKLHVVTTKRLALRKADLAVDSTQCPNQQRQRPMPFYSRTTQDMPRHGED